MNDCIKFEIPIKLISEANISDHWTKKMKRRKNLSLVTKMYFKRFRKKIDLPCNIKLTRISSRELDFDNLVHAFKTVRDSISDCIIPGLAPGRADSDKRIIWDYSQEKGKVKESSIRVEIYHSS
jgi:hypothetical protein